MVHFHFIRPLLLWALLLLPVLLFLVARSHKARCSWEKVCDRHLLKELLILPSRSQHYLYLIFFAVFWCLAIFIMAGPAWKNLPMPIYQLDNAFVVAVDLSPVMTATDLKPNRMLRARLKILDLIQKLPGQLGIVAFANEAYVVSPLTYDHHTLNALVDELSPDIMPVDGSNIRSALDRAAKLIFQSGQTRGNIILVTANTPTLDDIHEAKIWAKRGIYISVLAIGTPFEVPLFSNDGQAEQMVKLDESALKQLAANGSGVYTLFSPTNEDVNLLLGEFNTQIKGASSQRHSEALSVRYRDEGSWFMLLLLPFILYFGFKWLAL